MAKNKPVSTPIVNKAQQNNYFKHKSQQQTITGLEKIMTTIRFKLPKIEQVEFTIDCEPESMQIKGNCSAIDEDTDRETEQYIYDQLDSGNDWAWCCVKVTASYKGIEGTDYLGGCSYKSQKDFVAEGGYYEDMKLQAFNDLITNLQSLRDI